MLAARGNFTAFRYHSHASINSWSASRLKRIAFIRGEKA